MDGIQVLAVIGLIALTVSLLMFIGGVILLIISINKTVKHQKRIGGIVAGAILTITGFFVSVYIGVLFLIGGYGAAFTSSAASDNFSSDIEAALEDEDIDDLYDLFAKESYSGDELTREDAVQICEKIENTEFNKITATGTSWHNDVKAVNYKCSLTDEDSGTKITVTVSVIIKANNKGYKGIQYFKLTKDGTDYTYGTKLKLN